MAVTMALKWSLADEPVSHEGLPTAMWGREPYDGHSYIEVEMNGRRGRVIGYPSPDMLLVEFYAAGDREEVHRADVKITKRRSR